VILSSKTKSDIQKLDTFFQTNNNYLGMYKKNPESGNSDAVKTLVKIYKLI
jgi:hypothetical protein